MDLGRVRRLGAAVLERRRLYAAPGALAIALFLAFPTVSANQDIASMISGEDAGGVRWNGYARKNVADLIDAVQLSFRDGITTGASAAATPTGNLGGLSLTHGGKKAAALTRRELSGPPRSRASCR